MATPTNDFVPFATAPNAGVTAQSDYLASSVRGTGVVPGVADPNLANKAWRQSTWVAYGLAQFMCDTSGLNVLDDANYPNFKNALVSGINFLINTIVNAGSFATVSALASEAATRSSADSNEASLRSGADSYEATQRANADAAIYSYVNGKFAAQTDLSNEAQSRTAADQAIYTWVQANFSQRSNDANFTRQNFVPGDGSVVTITLSPTSGPQGGHFLVVASANVAGPQPSGASFSIFVNGSNVFGEYTSLSMAGMVGISAAGNSGFNLQAQYVCSNSGGKTWAQTTLNLSYIFVAG